MFDSTFHQCSRAKNITFEMNEDGTPKTANWKSQTIDLTSVGHSEVSGEATLEKIYDTVSSKCNILAYNSGITVDKLVYDDATYQALKDDPDWFSIQSTSNSFSNLICKNAEYSRYNHDSAVATINSLPDTSAYLASAGGTNTIKFKGSAGGATDGGAINTLTEEEIAVATAKGWTVTLV